MTTVYLSAVSYRIILFIVTFRRFIENRLLSVACESMDLMLLIGHSRVHRPTWTLMTNHGGVAVLSTSGIRLTHLDLGVNIGSFKMLWVRLTSVSSSCLAVLIYPPPSASVSAAFISELADIFDRVVTFSCSCWRCQHSSGTR